MIRQYYILDIYPRNPSAGLPMLPPYSFHLSVSVTASFFPLCQFLSLHLCPHMSVSVTASLFLSVSLCHCIFNPHLSASVIAPLSLSCQSRRCLFVSQLSVSVTVSLSFNYQFTLFTVSHIAICSPLICQFYATLPLIVSSFVSDFFQSP
jgi:hypothetical protein